MTVGEPGAPEGASSTPPEGVDPIPPADADEVGFDASGFDAGGFDTSGIEEPTVGDGSAAEANLAADLDTPQPGATDPLDVEGLVLSLETVTGDRDKWQDSAQRIQAEFENYKKQSQKRLDLDVERISGRIVESLLPVLDACDGAVVHGAEEVAPIQSALLDALSGHGLERLHPENDAFDPEAHEAVMHEAAADDNPGYPVVAEVMRAGYRWQGRVLRPAMVRVQG